MFLKKNKMFDNEKLIFKKIKLIKVKKILNNINWVEILNGIPNLYMEIYNLIIF